MTKIVKLQIAAVVCLMVLLLQGPVSAATYYVSTTGKDTASGSSSAPWASIDNGDKNSKVVSGDTVMVNAGTYSLSGTPAINISKVAGVTYKANSTATINLTNTSSSAVGWQISVANTTIDSFTIIGNGTTTIASNSVQLVLVENTNTFEMRNCTLTTTKIIQTSLLLSDVRTSYIHNNVIGPISSSANSGYLSEGLTESNCDPIGGNQYYNNTIVGVYGWAVDFNGANLDRSPRQFINNIVYNCDQGIYAQNSLTLSNNSVYDIGYSNYTYSGTSTGEWAISPIAGQVVPGPNDQNYADPMLDSTNHLLTGSPCIDAGQFVGIPYNGPRPDIGAFEASVGTAYSGSFGTLTGKVSDATTGIGLYEATVTSSLSNLIFTTTDMNGNYTLPVPAGSQGVTASAGHYQTTTTNANVVSGTQTLNFPLLPYTGVTYYVSPSGNDANSGTSSAAAWKSIDNGDKKGILNASDVVVVMSGVYTLANDPGISLSICAGVSGKPITYQAQAGVTIQGTSTGCALAINGPAQYLLLDGFTFSTSEYPLEINNSVGCEIRNCTITNTSVATDYGGMWVNNSTGCFIHNNLIGPLSTGTSLGLYADDGSANDY